jgi:hypothetical protein
MTEDTSSECYAGNVPHRARSRQHLAGSCSPNEGKLRRLFTLGRRE